MDKKTSKKPTRREPVTPRPNVSDRIALKQISAIR